LPSGLPSYRGVYHAIARKSSISNLSQHNRSVRASSACSLQYAAKSRSLLRNNFIGLIDYFRSTFFHDVALGANRIFALIVGFSFSMAVGRYDQRKNCDEAEANAIGTEYVRADLLSVVDNAGTAELQTELRSAVRTQAAGQPTLTLAV
jgi:hypothetical protein